MVRKQILRDSFQINCSP